MDRTYTIGRLATAAGIPTTTVRYYERRGLLRPVLRTGSGAYRAYGELELERLRFIRAAQVSGFSLEDIAALLSLRDTQTAPSAKVQELIRMRLEEVDARLGDLQRIQSILKSSLRNCRKHAGEGRCAVLGQLSRTRPRTARAR